MDDLLHSSLVLALLLFLFLGAGLWVSLALIGVGVVGMALFTSAPWGPLMASTIWGGINAWSLAALPLFIWMGEILFRSRLSDDLFEGLVPWVTHLPGRLLHVNIFGCGIFAAVSGSSAATAATVGKMAIPELSRRGYDQKMVLGTLAGSATLGLLIPPSIILIVYGVATEQSIARLFMAGILPGLMLMGLFVGFVVIWALIHPKAVPPPPGPLCGWPERLRSLPRLAPVLLLIAGVIGSIYAGIASPTDAAAVGVFLALVLSFLSRDLTRKTLMEGLLAATRTSCMIVFILAGASFLTLAMGFTGLPAGLAQWIAAMELSPYALLAALTVFFVVMGCFLDGISIVVLTTSIIQPMIEASGIDPIWFGIFLVIVVEMSQITPPVGFNLFVIQSLTGKNMLSIAWAALPFFLLMAVALVLLTLVPDIAIWLPNRM
ncbi:TRAP transporter large permease [Rhodospirillum sp. A1_3_36]|uniref:TRAP transporter large permease n=1 Tax=Rhodospirillum sp. A1_3_36 TaxID=3391666 RepID=UPI0039A42719